MARSIFITGASAGIGEALAVEFARRGCDLAIAARRVERLDGLADRLRRLGAPRVLALALDVTDALAVKGAIERAAHELGRLDVLVANAGVGYAMSIGRGKLDLARQVIETDLTGAVATVEYGLPVLRAQGGGQIVVITSVAGCRGQPHMGAYSAAKAGLHAYVQALRAEVWHEPIVVTELAPGYVRTDMNRDAKRLPFAIEVEKAAGIMAHMIERRVGHRYVPWWPWALVGPLLRYVPTRLLAPAPRVK